MAVPPQAAMGKEEMYARVDRLTHLILSTENLGENLTKTLLPKLPLVSPFRLGLRCESSLSLVYAAGYTV